MTPFAQAVAALGDTPESVSTLLREKGVKGKRYSASSCPIANYLKSCGFEVVTVADFAARYTSELRAPDECASLPDGVKNWIMQFDDGEYEEFSDSETNYTLGRWV